MAGPPSKSRKFDRSIIEGPIRPAVWRLAWPTMLQNLIAGLQGIIDHAMVGHFVGYTANERLDRRTAIVFEAARDDSVKRAAVRVCVVDAIRHLKSQGTRHKAQR